MTLPDGFSAVPRGKIAMVVTSLEMRAAPRLSTPAPALPDGLRLERVASPELAWYRDLFRRVGEPWLWFSRPRLPDATVAGIIRDPKVEIYAMFAGERSEGLLELDFRVPGECELAYVGVTEAFLGAGVGRALVRHALERAWSRPVTRLWLHTCTLDHPAALGFYRRSGFVPFLQQVEITDDPRLTGEMPFGAGPNVPVFPLSGGRR